MKILLVFGTRPEAIKMAPLIKEFQKEPEFFETIVCVTGQHREMLDQVLNLFEIIPDYDLNIMKSDQDLFDITTKVLSGMKDVLIKSKPDVVLVHGDTSTSTAAALASFYQQIPVGHIEAGLRTDNKYRPWPEEMNRQITSRLATFHFAPTLLNQRNLIKENIKKEHILITGNTVIDALFWVLDKMRSTQHLMDKISNELIKKGLNLNIIQKYVGTDDDNLKNKLVIITCHRRENFGKGFINIFGAIKELSETHSDVDFIFPVHLNHNVREAAEIVFGDISSNREDNIHFIDPLDYLTFVYLMNKAFVILTDSGGIQEEAPSLGKPVLVMRDTTERPEAVKAQSVHLVGTNKETIIKEVDKLFRNKDYYTLMSNTINPYGDGKACARIVNFFKSSL